MSGKNGVELSFKDILKMLFRQWYIIVGVVILSSILCYCYTSFIIQPQYTSTAVFILSYSADDGSSSASNANSELTYSKNIVANCVQVISQNKFFNELSIKLDNEVSGGTLAKSVSYSTSSNTSVIKAKITTNNPQLSCKIAEVMIANVGSYIDANFKFAGDETIKISPINTPVVPTSPSAPNKMLYTFIVALASFVIACVVVVIINLADTRIKSEEDLVEISSIPVLANIPLLEVKEANDD